MSDFDTSIATHIKLNIEGHASPRWRGASSADEADKRNLDLSRRRAESVRKVLEGTFRSALSGRELFFSYNFEHVDPHSAGGHHQVHIEASGSRNTLREADGNRRSDAEHLRRVDVSAELTYIIKGAAPSTHPYRIPVNQMTRRWAIKVGMGANVHVVAGASFAAVKLKNRDTGTAASGEILASGTGVGPKWKPLGASVTWGDYTNFTVRRPMNHNGFNGKGVRLTSASVGILVVGYELTYLTIYGVGSNAHSMSVGGLNMGALAASAFTDHGNLWIQTPPVEYETVARTEWEDYMYKLKRDYGHVVRFETNSDTTNSEELGLLEKWAVGVAKDFRSNTNQ